jgi:hypothetical protein
VELGLFSVTAALQKFLRKSVSAVSVYFPQAEE